MLMAEQDRGEKIVVIPGKAHYAVRFWKPLRRFSSAPFNGGTGLTSTYINRHVPFSYNGNPRDDISGFLILEGYGSEETTVTLTACDTGKATHRLLDFGSYFLHISITAGTENALSIGSEGKHFPGTVNIAVATDATLDDSASLNLYQSVVEARSQAFNDAGVRDRDTGKTAPGTSTDTVSIFVGDEGEYFQYGGRLSRIGKALSVAVYEMILEKTEEDCI